MTAEYIAPTSAEIEEIKQGKRETINRVYMANYEFIKRLARGYCNAVRRYSEYLDFAHEVYLNFEKLSFENVRYFVQRVKNIFRLYRIGGKRKEEQLRFSKCGVEMYTLDTPFDNSEDESFVDSIASNFDITEEIEPRPDYSEKIFNYLCGYLAKEQKRVFTEVFWTGKTIAEIAETLNKKASTTGRTREEVFKKFRKNADSIKKWLYETGYYVTA